ncbi:Putative cell-wall binding lipoprotein [Amphibacillus marinus]|uniref:Putative cell-wall binding lipoprotein n=1 Tax=Amphibacillus marinus TaxID=872970 RepID=A0A1H8I9B8_9BACI|nr:YkyA family protein [Amphibacillus marinus]SEN64974.1 Putative cell-wall binding lipoprotein [Amphibacillus marinus]
MRVKWLGLFLLSSLLLVACSGESTQEQIYEHMEESVQLEADFVAQQQPLNELEQEEQEIYEQITELGMEDFDEIVSLAQQAIESIESRKALTENELDSIQASKDEFDQIEELISDLEDESLVALTNNLVDLMEERYQAFVTLNEVYVASLEYDQELYELLMQDDLQEEAYTEQVNLINDQYQLIQEANTSFNDATDAFNEQKREFYDQSDLNITYE